MGRESRARNGDGGCPIDIGTSQKDRNGGSVFILMFSHVLQVVRAIEEDGQPRFLTRNILRNFPQKITVAEEEPNDSEEDVEKNSGTYESKGEEEVVEDHL